MASAPGRRRNPLVPLTLSFSWSHRMIVRNRRHRAWMSTAAPTSAPPEWKQDVSKSEFSVFLLKPKEFVSQVSGCWERLHRNRTRSQTSLRCFGSSGGAL